VHLQGQGAQERSISSELSPRTHACGHAVARAVVRGARRAFVEHGGEMAPSVSDLPPIPTAEELRALGTTPGPTKLSTPLTPQSGRVCVTGASGFIAMHLVSQLLVKGYEVVATVRSEAKAGQVRALGEQYPSKLTVVGGCDLLKEGSFDGAIAGCVAVYHTASPFYPAQDKGAGVSAAGFEELVLPAVLGTRQVLESCRLAGTVKRVVVTASFACIINTSFAPDATYHDGIWNVESFPESSQAGLQEWTQAGAGMHAYRYSKIMAEKTAWEVANRNDTPFDVVTINPPLVIGENLDVVDAPSSLNESSSMVFKWLTQKPSHPPNGMAFVDVVDVARAHIIGMEAVRAGGNRYLTSAPALLWADVAAVLRQECPENPNVATAAAQDPKRTWTMDTSRLEALGMTFTPAAEALKTQIASVLKQFPEAAHGLEPKASANWDKVPLEGKKTRGGSGVLRKVGLPVLLIAALAWLWRLYQKSKKAIPSS
jgi:nucleoside-diphosphate-sugar epimerase